MNRGIEAAYWGVLGKDPELRTSKTGKPFATMNVVVTIGESDDGKDVSQWIRTVAFGEAAEKIAATAKKGDRVYCEGQLTLNTWADKATGETKTGLNVAAWKCEKVPGIGRNRQRREPEYEVSRQNDHAGPTAYVHQRAPITAPTYAGPAHRRERPKIQGLNDDFDDKLPF
jgi:single stranded DNA-binding protein